MGLNEIFAIIKRISSKKITEEDVRDLRKQLYREGNNIDLNVACEDSDTPIVFLCTSGNYCTDLSDEECFESMVKSEDMLLALIEKGALPNFSLESQETYSCNSEAMRRCFDRYMPSNVVRLLYSKGCTMEWDLSVLIDRRYADLIPLSISFATDVKRVKADIVDKISEIISKSKDFFEDQFTREDNHKLAIIFCMLTSTIQREKFIESEPHLNRLTQLDELFGGVVSPKGIQLEAIMFYRELLNMATRLNPREEELEVLQKKSEGITDLLTLQGMAFRACKLCINLNNAREAFAADIQTKGAALTFLCTAQFQRIVENSPIGSLPNNVIKNITGKLVGFDI